MENDTLSNKKLKDGRLLKDLTKKERNNLIKDTIDNLIDGMMPVLPANPINTNRRSNQINRDKNEIIANLYKKFKVGNSNITPKKKKRK